LFVEQCLGDTEVARRRLFAGLPEIDLIDFQVTHPLSGALIRSGSVTLQEARTVEHIPRECG
jgi:hypothetical protein